MEFRFPSAIEQSISNQSEKRFITWIIIANDLSNKLYAFLFSQKRDVLPPRNRTISCSTQESSIMWTCFSRVSKNFG